VNATISEPQDLRAWLRRYGRESGLRQQARYVARQVGDEYVEAFVAAAPRLLTQTELDEIVARMLDCGRALLPGAEAAPAAPAREGGGPPSTPASLS